MHGESAKHAYARREHVQWAGRQERVLEELQRLDAQVYCLQEMSLGALASTFIPRMREVSHATSLARSSAPCCCPVMTVFHCLISAAWLRMRSLRAHH